MHSVDLRSARAQLSAIISDLASHPTALTNRSRVVAIVVSPNDYALIPYAKSLQNYDEIRRAASRFDPDAASDS